MQGIDDSIGRFVVIFGVALSASLVLRYLVPKIARRTDSDVDDAVVRLLEPVVLLVGVAVAYWQASIAPLWWSSDLGDLNVPTRLVVTATAFFFVYRLIKDVFGALLERHAQQTQGTADDVVTPILVHQIVPTVLVILAVLASFWVFGGSIGTGIATAGGLSFLLVYLLQDPLSNLFGGLSLALDVPFGYGDLVTLEDGKTYAVRKIGSRVTQLYDIAEHNSVYIPNVALTQQRLINLFLPNAELRQHITIGVAYETENLADVPGLLIRAADLHPNVLGLWETKSKLLEQQAADWRAAAEQSEALVVELERSRLGVETELRMHSEAMLRYARLASDEMARLEARGLDLEEIVRAKELVGSLVKEFDELRAELSEWVFMRGVLLLRYTRNANEGLCPPSVDEFESAAARFLSGWRLDVDEGTLSKFIRGSAASALHTIGDLPVADELIVARLHFASLIQNWIKSDQLNAIAQTSSWLDAFDSWEAYETFANFYGGWHKPIHDMRRILDNLQRRLDGDSRKLFRLHQDLERLVKLIESQLPLRVDAHRKPDADLAAFAASSIDFELDFFVDDVAGDYYERVGDVRGAVLENIHRLFTEAGIEIPYQKVDVSLVAGPNPPSGLERS